MTDVPYGKKHLPIYAALAAFAMTVLVPRRLAGVSLGLG